MRINAYLMGKRRASYTGRCASRCNVSNLSVSACLLMNSNWCGTSDVCYTSTICENRISAQGEKLSEVGLLRLYDSPRQSRRQERPAKPPDFLRENGKRSCLRIDISRIGTVTFMKDDKTQNCRKFDCWNIRVSQVLIGCPSFSLHKPVLHGRSEPLHLSMRNLALQSEPARLQSRLKTLEPLSTTTLPPSSFSSIL